MTVRTRFAPSPTGRLHLGNVRAAAFNWLFARRHAGAFVLRIEDTDVERNAQGGEEGILEDLRWLGLDWDEGPGVEGPHAPYRQSQRGAVYAAAVEALVASGRAYPCFCVEGDLESEIGKDGREVRRYSGRCRSLDPAARARRLAEGPPPVIRFAVPEGVSTVEMEDDVFGSISFPANDIDDFVIRRSDGRVTYNFAVVVDDVDMEITHVIRGVGHLSNTPKQALLFDALERPRPVFAHLPTVLGPDGHKLSKRDGAAAVAELRRLGYPADAVLNYLSLLGWSHPEGKEVLSRQELVESVALDRVGRSDTQMDPEKLLWLSAQHLAQEDLTTLAANVAPFLDEERFAQARAHWPQVVDALRTRLNAYGTINDHLPLLYGAAEGRGDAAAALAGYPGAAGVLEGVSRALEALDAWEDPALSAAVRAAGREVGAKGGSLFHPVRLALIGSETGPDVAKLLAALGRQDALGRLRAALARNRGQQV
jgi:glutamyl-tRNA synthetase